MSRKTIVEGPIELVIGAIEQRIKNNYDQYI